MSSTNCYHCHEPIPAHVHLEVDVLGQPRAMCCVGCAAVAESIVAAGLTDYYKHRTDVATKVEGDLVPQALKTQFQQLDMPELQDEFCTTEGEQKEALLSVDGVKCAACAWLIETQLYKQDGVTRASVNASSHRLLLRWNPRKIQLSTLLQSLAKLGYQALPYDREQEETQFKKQKQSYLIRLGVSALASMQVMMYAVTLYFGVVDMEPLQQLYMRWVSLLMATPVIVYAAWPFYISAWNSIKALQPNMDVPVSLALILAYTASAYATIHETGEVYFESISMFVFFLLVGRYFELMARLKAHSSNANAVKLLPAVAHRLTESSVETIPVKLLKAGDAILLKPGETMPVDGRVSQGHSHVDLSVLTGEHEPQPCQVGDTLYAGAINQEQPLHIEVLEVKETLVASIVRLQEQALAERSQTLAFADKVARYFVVALLLIACATAFIWWQIQPEHALWVTLAVLVATCPCALSLATPAAMTSGLSRLSEIGLIARRGNLLNELAQVDTLVLDKTGTITQGKLKVSQVHCYGDASTTEVTSVAQALELGSGHPLAQAILSLSPSTSMKAENVKHTAGLGLQGLINDELYYLGSPASLPEHLKAKAPNHRVLLSNQNAILGGFDFDDPIRPDAHALLAKLPNLKLTPALLSGDQQSHVDQMATELQLGLAIGEQTPQGKQEWVKEQQSQGKRILMVGDGINDSPVLAQANASIAIADGTDIAKRSADAVLLSPHLQSIAKAVAIAKSTQSIIRQNLAWAIGYNLLILPVAVSGLLPPYLAVIGMSASSLIVVTNALRVGKNLQGIDS